MLKINSTLMVKMDHDSRYFYLRVGKNLIYKREALPSGYPPLEFRVLYEILKETSRIVKKYNLNDITYTDDDVVGIITTASLKVNDDYDCAGWEPKDILKKVPYDSLPLLINEGQGYKEAIAGLLNNKNMICPVCNTTQLRNKGLLLCEAYICGLCEKEVCRECIYTYEDITAMNLSGDIPQYIVINIEPHIEYICNKCLCNIEKDYIDEIPSENLPLHINDDWYFEENKSYFNQTLKK